MGQKDQSLPYGTHAERLAHWIWLQKNAEGGYRLIFGEGATFRESDTYFGGDGGGASPKTDVPICLARNHNLNYYSGNSINDAGYIPWARSDHNRPTFRYRDTHRGLPTHCRPPRWEVSVRTCAWPSTIIPGPALPPAGGAWTRHNQRGSWSTGRAEAWRDPAHVATLALLAATKVI